MTRFLDALGVLFDGRFHLRAGEVDHEWSDVLNEAIDRYGVKENPESLFNFTVIVGPFTIWVGGVDTRPYSTGLQYETLRIFGRIPRRKVALRILEAVEAFEIGRPPKDRRSRARKTLDEYIAENP